MSQPLLLDEMCSGDIAQQLRAKSDCQPVSAPDGPAALTIPYRRKCSVTPIRGARIGESARSAHVKPVTEPSASPRKPG